MNRKVRSILKIFSLGLVCLLGGLLLLFTPVWDSTSDIVAEKGGTLNAIRREIAYRRPVTLDKDKTMHQIYQAPLDLQDARVIFTDVELWQGNSNNVWLALRFRELDPSGPAPKIFIAFRDCEEVAWLTGDTFLRAPTLSRGDSATQEFWFYVMFDEEALRRDPRNPPEWFACVANSTIEVGLVKGQDIIIAHPNNETVAEETPLTYLHAVANVKLFTD